MKTRRTTVPVPEDLYLEAKALAAKRGGHLHAVFAEALRLYLETNRVKSEKERKAS